MVEENSLSFPIVPHPGDDVTSYKQMMSLTCDEADGEAICLQRGQEAEKAEKLTSRSSLKLAKISTVNFPRNLDRNPIYEFTSFFEECAIDDQFYNDAKSSEIDDTSLLEPNPIYDSTPAAIRCMDDNPLYNGINVHNDSKLSEEPIYNELLTFQLSCKRKFSSKEILNKSELEEFGEDKSQVCNFSLEPTYDVILKKRADTIRLVEPKNICEMSVLGIGQFGEVSLAETVGLSEKDLKLGNSTDRNVRFLVAVKKLKDKADNTMKESFEKEIRFMSKLSDQNIVCLLAVCKKEPKFIVIEYMENGDLYQFLNRHELASCTSETQKNYLQVSTLLYMSVQIASGMKYLASLKYVHRDLASRNCLVGQNFVVKVSDFGMSRNLYESVYYRVRGQLILPIRWMATESFYGMFCEKTDIWSFGVTMWEIFTLGRFPPYNDLRDEQIIKDAVKGNKRKLLPKPMACPELVYSVMLQCWEHKMEDRANFKEVHISLDEIDLSTENI